MLTRVAPDLREAHIEKEAADAGMREYRVENLAPFGVAVPTLVYKLAYDSARKGCAVAVCFVDKTRERIRVAAGVYFAVAQERDEIAQAKKAKSRHARSFSVVNQFVNPTGLETVF